MVEVCGVCGGGGSGGEDACEAEGDIFGAGEVPTALEGRRRVPRSGLMRPTGTDLKLIEMEVEGGSEGELQAVALGCGVDLVGVFEFIEALPCFAALEKASHGGGELDQGAFGVELNESEVIHRKEGSFEGKVILGRATDGEGLSVFKGSLIEDRIV